MPTGATAGAAVDLPVMANARSHMCELWNALVHSRSWNVVWKLGAPIRCAFILAKLAARWLANVARGELGYSFSQHRAVRDVFADAIPHTLLLSGLAWLFRPAKSETILITWL